MAGLVGAFGGINAHAIQRDRWRQSADPVWCKDGFEVTPALQYRASHVAWMPSWPLVLALVCAGCAGCNGLRIDNVAPAVAVAGGTLSIDGAGFLAQTQFALVHAGTEVSLGAVALTSETRATATIPSAAPDGVYDLLARASGAEARAVGAVEVSSQQLQVFFLDVGQGDATLIIAPGGASLLVDGGPRDAAQVVRDAISTHAQGHLDAVVLSHTDADHLGGIEEVLAGPDHTPGTTDDVVPATRLTYIDDGSCDSLLCADTRRLAAWPFALAHVGDTIALGPAEVTVVATDGDVGRGRMPAIDVDNERSVAVRVAFGGRTVLITGDLTGGGLGDENVEGQLASVIGRVDVLHLSHHGSATSSRLETLRAFDPRAIVVSLGTDNPYCHPATLVAQTLSTLGVSVFATGSGMVAEGDRCGGPTVWPPGARVGLGTFVLRIGADGAMQMNGEVL